LGEWQHMVGAALILSEDEKIRRIMSRLSKSSEIDYATVIRAEKFHRELSSVSVDDLFKEFTI